MSLLSSNAGEVSCVKSAYSHRGQPLCFSSQHKTYLSKSCLAGACQALRLIRQGHPRDPDQAGIDSRHPGSKLCALQGGETRVVESQSGHRLCVCEMPDRSAIGCARIGL
jgi:putative hemolysin